MDYKTVAFDFKDTSGSPGEFTGYAAAFNNVDLGGDRIVKGAFKRTINSSKGRVPVLYQHREPIGQGLKAQEDNKGLLVKGQLFLEDEFPEARKAHKLVERGMIKHMSIGYEVMRQEFVREKGEIIRELKEIKLREYSLVLFSMNPAATLTGMKNEDMQTVKDILANYDPDRQAEFLKAVLMEVEVYDSDSDTRFESISESVSESIRDFGAADLCKSIEAFSKRLRNRS